MTKKLIPMIFLLAGSFFISSCSKNDCSAAVEAAEAFAEAGDAYDNSPTPANCAKYKDAINDFVSKAADCTEFGDDLDIAKDELKGLTCK
jgi:uncharacterized protein YaaR (DUF327 family)